MGSTRKTAHSLRLRYFANALVLGVIVVGYALYSYLGIKDANQRSVQSMVLIDSQLELLGRIHNSVADLYQLTDRFLIDPTQGEIPARIDDGILSPMERDLQALRLGRALGVTSQVDDLSGKLAELRRGLARLFSTRLDPTLQYPAMAVAAAQMGGIQRNIASRLGILEDEIEHGGFVPLGRSLLPQLLKTQLAWAQANSQLRIYLANRLASFSTDILDAQADSVSEIFVEFRARLDELAQVYELEDSFEAPQMIEEIQALAEDWRQAFVEVRRINETERWREDSHLMKVMIIPAVDAIDDALDEITDLLRQRQLEATASIKANADRQSLVLAAVILLFMLFIFALLGSMEHLVFRPISRVTQALRSKAFGKQGPQLCEMASREMQYLVEAYEEMDVQVTHRERALEYQAQHDSLTALPNRSMLSDRLDQALKIARRQGSNLALLLIDLDNFKEVNDSLGHQAGDALLMSVSATLQNNLREADTIARLGGDEFAVLLPDAGREEAVVVAEKVAAYLRQAFKIRSYSIQLGASIGISLCPEDGDTSQILLQHADVAMYTAKRQHRNYAFYAAKEDTNSPDRIALVSDLRLALENGDLALHFQPWRDLVQGEFLGAEALLRWQHPRFGPINPERIVEIAENVGLINQLTGWVLDRALEDCRRWEDAGHRLSVAVNLSLHDLGSELLSGQVEGALARHRIDSSRLCLEVSENGVMANPGRAVKMLEKLAHLGVQLAVDDYGVGFSSLDYLKKLPVQSLKIDKSFVTHMDGNGNDAIIVRSTIDLGHNLGLRVLAEGVETDAVCELLADAGCDACQGYLFSWPLPPDEFLTWLEGAGRQRRPPRSAQFSSKKQTSTFLPKSSKISL